MCSFVKYEYTAASRVGSILWKETDMSRDDKVIVADFMYKIMNTLNIMLEIENLKYAIIGSYWRERGGLLRNVMQVYMIRYLLEKKINIIRGTYETALHSIDLFVFGS